MTADEFIKNLHNLRNIHECREQKLRKKYAESAALYKVGQEVAYHSPTRTDQWKITGITTNDEGSIIYFGRPLICGEYKKVSVLMGREEDLCSR